MASSARNTKRIPDYHKFEMIVFSTLKIRKTHDLYIQIKTLIHCIKNTYLLIDYVQGMHSLKSIYFWFVF